MDPLSIAGTIISAIQITSSLISVCYDYRAGVKSASREVVQLTDELNSLRDVLEALLHIAESAPLPHNSSTRLSTFELLIKDGGPLETCITEVERLEQKLKPQEGWRRLRQALVWPLKEEEMKKALDALERLKGTMSLALSADQAALSLTIKEDVGDLTHLVTKYGDDQQRLDIHRWLAAPEPYANHLTNRKKCCLNTGTWLLMSKQYGNWMQSPKSFLWLHGIPGSGKSVLCSTIIEQLENYCERISGTILAYYYFDFNDSGKRDVNGLIRSLVKQLSTQGKTIPRPLLELFHTHGNGSKPAEELALIKTLQDLVSTFQNVYVVIDALDESENCEELLDFICTARGWQFDHLHFIVTSRQLPEIEESLKDLITDKLCLNELEMNEDIKIYVGEKIRNDKVLDKWPENIRQEIQTKLLVEEDGMFQWVVCQLDMLRCCKSVSAVRKAMSSMPKSLNETYERILTGIDESHQADAMKVLQALTVSVDYLSLDEVTEILAVDLDSTPPRFEPESRMLDPSGIISMCSSLVTLGNEPQQSFLGIIRATPALRLAHASVADFLTRSDLNQSSKFHFTESEARQFLAQTCLVYLLNSEFSSGDHDSLHHAQLHQRLKSFPFLKHCSFHWPIYLKKHPGDPENHLNKRTMELIQEFFATSKLPGGGNFAAWVRMLIPASPSTYIRNTPPLYYAASFGLTEVVRIILDTDKDLDINALGGRVNATALHVAVYRNHYDVVKMLLELGADPNIPNEVGEPPIYWARVNKNGGMKELLNRYGADTRKQRFRFKING